MTRLLVIICYFMNYYYPKVFVVSTTLCPSWKAGINILEIPLMFLCSKCELGKNREMYSCIPLALKFFFFLLCRVVITFTLEG